MIFYHITPAANLPSIFKNGLIPTIGPRASVGKEERAGIWLFAYRQDALEAVKTWFLLENGNDLTLQILEVELPHGADCLIRGRSFESICYSRIPPDFISVDHPLDLDPHAWAMAAERAGAMRIDY